MVVLDTRGKSCPDTCKTLGSSPTTRISKNVTTRHHADRRENTHQIGNHTRVGRSPDKASDVEFLTLFGLKRFGTPYCLTRQFDPHPSNKLSRTLQISFINDLSHPKRNFKREVNKKSVSSFSKKKGVLLYEKDSFFCCQDVYPE